MTHIYDTVAALAAGADAESEPPEISELAAWRLLALAEEYDHLWGQWSRGHCLNHHAVSLLRGGRLDVMREQVEQDMGTDYGILSPDWDAHTRTYQHVTTSGRIAWQVYTTGHTLIEVRRPGPPRTVAMATVIQDAGAEPEIATMEPIGLRHLEALRRALRAVARGDRLCGGTDWSLSVRYPTLACSSTLVRVADDDEQELSEAVIRFARLVGEHPSDIRIMSADGALHGCWQHLTTYPFGYVYTCTRASEEDS